MIQFIIGEVEALLRDALGNFLTSKDEGLGVRSLDVNLRSRALPATYRAAFASLATYTVNAGTNGDLITLLGSASKTVKIHKVLISGNGSTAQQGSVNLILRSTADTGGTSSPIAAVPLDSSNAAATAVARSYTSAPIQGTAVGTLASIRKLFPLASSATLSGDVALFDSFREHVQPITLRGNSEQLCINLSNTSGNFAPTLSGFIEFTEE
jgi:hypothetical protein